MGKVTCDTFLKWQEKGLSKNVICEYGARKINIKLAIRGERRKEIYKHLQEADEK